MVYDSKTYKVLHGLTPEGEKLYAEVLERKADEILFRAKHPVRWLLGVVLEKLGF